MVSDIFIAFGTAVASLFSWPLIAFLLLGTVVGLVFGTLPGLGGPVAIALLIPISFGMETTSALVLFGATLGGVAFGGSASAILINIPGTAPNAATCLDGHPMARDGRAGEALGISATASAVGAIFGVIVLLLVLPFSRELLMLLDPPHYFWIAILGLTAVASVSRGNVTKGLLSGALGLLLSFVGYSNVHSTYRYGFGSQYLFDGIHLITVIIGIYAIAEAFRLFATEDESISASGTGSVSNVRAGVRYVVVHPVSVLRASVTGVLVGVIPGAGGAVANFLAYMQAKQSSADPDTFGTGNPEGVLASEASNDAKDGGSLLPTVLFGIPGSAAMAVLLGAFLIHGLTPGRALLNEDLPLLLTLIAALLLANVLTSLAGLSVANHLVKLTSVSSDVLVPAIVTISLVGAFALRNSLYDVYVATLFGVLGLVMVSYGYSRIPLILGVILGPFAERYFFQSIQMSDQGYRIFVADLLSVSLIALIIVVLVVTLRGTRRTPVPELQP